MKLSTTEHPLHPVSSMSENIAEFYKGKRTEAQYEVLKHNVYTIEETDDIAKKYHGCGCGWVEIDAEGKAVDLKYLDGNIVNWQTNGSNVWDDDYEQFAIVEDLKSQHEYLSCGVEEANIWMLEFADKEQLMPHFLQNGNIRLLVNFSSYQLVRF